MSRNLAFVAACLALLVVAAATACSGQQKPDPAAATSAALPSDRPRPTRQSRRRRRRSTPFRKTCGSIVDKPFTGDFDEMVKRRVIRVAVTFNRTHYFIDKGQERGITYEALKAFENDLNTELKTGNLKVHVVIVPMPRDQLYPALAGGKVDMVAAMVTVRPELEKLVAFSEPTRTNVSQVVVTGPGAPPIATVDDLAGQEVFVRKGSVYSESLARLNAQLKARGKPAVVIDEAPARPRRRRRARDGQRWPRADYRRRRLPGGVLEPGVHQHQGAPGRHRADRRQPGGRIPQGEPTAPGGRQQMDPEARKGGRVPKRARTPVSPGRHVREKRRGRHRAPEVTAVVELFKKYGTQYNVDYLLMAAQGYQESTLDQNVKSPVGAIGVMQVMPPTGKELNVGDITQIEPNIHAGVKYMRFMMDPYFKDEPMDKLNKAPDDVCVLQRRAGTGADSCAARPRRGASIPTCGSATSSASPRSGSAARRSPTSATSTSTTSRTV